MEFDARKLNPEQQEVLRRNAIELVYEEGYSYRAAAKVLKVARRHVSKWCRLYESGGWNALLSGKRGRPKGVGVRLQPFQCAIIVRTIVDKTPDQLKLPFVLWTRAAIRDWIEKKFGVLLPLTTLGDYLRRWGFSPQKPIRKAYRQNSKKVKEWLEKDYPAIAADAKKEGAVIYWVDETGFTNKVNNVRGYAPKGKTPELKEEGQKFRINMISGVTNKGEVRFRCYEGSMNQTEYLRFLRELIESEDRKVYVIADNLVVHHGKRVKAWVENHADEIRLEYIPSYSPELNADEYLNRDAKRNINIARAPRTLDELKKNVVGFMNFLRKAPARVQSYFNGRHIKYAAAV